MRNYYVKYNQFGINFTADSIGWDILTFPSPKERNEWLFNHDYQNGNKVAAIVKSQFINKYLRPKAGQNIAVEYDEGREANKLVVRW